MTYYAVAMAVTLVLSYYATTVYSLPNGGQLRGVKNGWKAFLVLLPLTFLAVFRWDVGVDTVYGYNYWDSFHQAANWANPREFEPGFFLVTVLLSKTGMSYWCYLTVFALAYMSCVSYAMAKGSIWVRWSVLVFFLLFCYFNSFNLLRQSMAEAICLIAWANMGYLRPSRKKDVGILLLFSLAATFHLTALINIPLFLLSKIRFSRSGLLKIGIFAALISPILQAVISFVMELVAGDRYSVSGFALINACLTGFLFLLCWYFYDTICSLDENAYLYVNLSLFIFIVLLNSGVLFLPFRIFDMMKIAYIFIIPYLLKGIPNARGRLGMEFLIFSILGLWFFNAFYLQNSSFAAYQTVFRDFWNLIRLP